MASPQQLPSFAELVEQVAQLGNAIKSQLDANSLPHPGFEADVPRMLPLLPEVQQARMGLIDATSKLLQLAIGPEDYYSWSCFFTRYDTVLWGVLARYNIAACVPLEGSISYEDLSAKCGLHRDRLFRFIRLARTIQIFQEPKPGFVAHTAFSAQLVTKPAVTSYLKMTFEGASNVSRKIIESNDKYGDSQDINQSAAALAYNVQAPDTLWSFFENDGEGEEKGWRMRMVAECLEATTSGPTFSDVYIHEALDWDSLGKATVVDVGGSNGHVSFELAKKHPNLNIVVQDLPTIQAKFDAACPSELKSRVSYRVHNFFDFQPNEKADFYFMRAILHDWPDQRAIQIVKNLVAVMKPSSRIILFESITPEFGEVPSPLMHLMSCLDIEMMSMFNAKERTLQNWKDLMRTADSRLTLEKSVTPLGSHLSFLIFELEQ
ncbi:S-adenosyl-L-methionine-dependent methyltransferase [Xylogone sp. PMI_703]|nr:S-adenosyl-L-methionine-dependent methyltransferase [Xylogone sp. PMI_703]